MNEHTKGPWLYGADKCQDNATALEICMENVDACTKESSGYFYVVYVADGRRTALVGHGPDGEANAKLIAAAPDLLEALEDITNRFENCIRVYAIADDEEMAKIPTANAREVIAKARGSRE